MLTLNECAALLRGNDRFCLLTHTRPDGDTLCSAAALCSALRRMGKKAALFRNPEITETYAPLTAPYLYTEGERGFVVACDVADVTMLPETWKGEIDLAIDHHPKNPGYARATLLDGSKASCGELVMELIELLCGGMTAEEATLLYIAVSTDTGCFSYGNTRAATLRAAAHLIDSGADNGELNRQFFRSYSPGRIRLEGLVYANLQSFRNNQVNIAVVTLDMMRQAGATEDDCEDLASLPGKVRGNQVGITVRELEPGKCKVSVRTGTSVNSAELCARFGGGGHPMAAGCTLNTDPEIAALLMQAALNEAWPEK